jgi:O-antigen/teichoic acid export membrane protein
MKVDLPRRVRTSTLVQNAGWMFGGYGVRTVIQGLYFVLIARGLGAQQYGAFVAITALVAIAAPFAGFGAANLLVKNVSRNRSVLAAYWGNGLILICASGVAFLVIVVGFARFFLPGSVAVASVLFVGISDLVLLPLVDLAAAAFQAIEMMNRSAQLQVLISGSRLVGIFVLLLIRPHPSAVEWTQIYVLATAATAVFALAALGKQAGAPRHALRRIGSEFIEGIYFSAGLSAQSIYNNIDKTMLSRMVSLDAAGVYAAAYRFIDVAFAPVQSLLSASYPRFFRHGADGIQASRSYGLRLTRPSVIYSLVAAVAMLMGAPILPMILGSQFARTAEVLRWLALLPLLKTLHYFMANALTGAGHQGTRTSMQAVVAVFNVLVNLWIIPAYGWRGAAGSSLASDGLLAALMYSAISFKCRRGHHRNYSFGAAGVAPQRTLES